MQELEMVAGIIENLSSGAMTGFLFYLGYKLLGVILGYVFGGIVLVVVYKMGTRIITNIMFTDEIAAMCGMCTPLMPGEKNRVRSIIQQGLGHPEK